MKKYFLLIAAPFFLMACTQNAFATHAAALDLSYQCYGNNQYQFVATFYRDCNGISAPTSLPLTLVSPSCGYGDSSTYSLQLVYSTEGTDSISHLAGLCPDLNSQCTGGSYTGYEQYIYAVTVTLPFTCSDWRVATRISARNNAITNLQDPGNQDLYDECYFSNANGLCDNSPLFTTIPLAYACSGELFIYNHGAYDPDGDSLAYTLVNPLNAHGSPINFVGVFTPTYPLTTVDGTFGFNPLTGQMSCTPSGIQIAVISVLIEEYRDGLKIGSVQRDLQIVVKTCNNQVPTIPDGIVDVTGGFLVDSNTVQICPGGLLSFNVVGVDSDAADSLSMTTNLPITIPGATYSISGVNPDTFHFSWQTTPNDTGFYVFTVTVKDNGCPISAISVYSFTVQVGAPDVVAGPDVTTCADDAVIQLHVDGLPDYLWSNGQYLDDPTSMDPVATLPGPGDFMFIVTANVGGLCENYDTVLVHVIGGPPVDFTAEQIGCAPFTTQFISDSSSDIATYHWDFGDGDTSNVDDPTHTYSSPGTYSVSLTCTNSFGCDSSITKTAFITVLPQPVACFDIQDYQSQPYINGTPYDISQASFSFVNCSENGTTYTWDFGDSTTSSEENPQHTYQNTDTFYVTLTVDNGYCSDTQRIGPIIIVYYHIVNFPLAFSPNSDGKNDFFHEVGGLGITQIHYQVYNRWGEMVYEANSENDPGWDGKYKGKESPLGVYVWLCDATFVNGAHLNFKGNVTLVR